VDLEYPGGEIPNGNGARCHVASITVLSERIGIRERLRWHRRRQHGELSRRQATAYSSSQIIPDVSKTAVFDTEARMFIALVAYHDSEPVHKLVESDESVVIQGGARRVEVPLVDCGEPAAVSA
jgi:hypothetical protein